MNAPTIIYEGVPDDGSPPLSFTGRGAHHAAAAAIRHAGGKVYRLTPEARTLVMVVLKVPPAPPAPDVETVEF